MDNGADINAQYGRGETPLSDATLYGHRDVVELLLARGADITAGVMADEISLQDASNKSPGELAEYLVTKYGPYSIIVTDPRSVRKLLRYWKIGFDGLWIPKEADLEGLGAVLRSHLQSKTPIKAKEHFDRELVLIYLDQYSREYSGITRDGARYVICQMILPHRFPARPPENTLTMIHGSANRVIRFVFEVESKTIVEIDCEYVM